MKTFLSAVFLFVCFSAFSQESIDTEKIKKHVYTLASDSMQGRETGTEGQRMAARYIAGQFKMAGLAPAGNGQKDNPYFQRFAIYYPKTSYAFLNPDTAIPAQRIRSSVYVNGEKRNIVYDETAYRNNLHLFYISAPKLFSDSIRPVTYAGKCPLKSDFPAGNTLVLEARTLDEVTHEVFRLYQEKRICSFIIALPGKQLDRIISEFPDGRFLTGTENNEKGIYKLGMIRPHRQKFPPEIKALYDFCLLHTDCEITIVGSRIRKDLFPEKNANQSSFFRYSVYSQGLWDSLETENVAAVLEGKSKDLIVVGAHYDHVGTSGKGIFYGADDNASGTAAVMEIARDLAIKKQQGKNTEKSIVFVAFTAEEEGLIGSEAFLLNNGFENRKISCMINMDMIGRNDKRNDTLSNYTYCLALAGNKRKLRKTAKIASVDVMQKNIIHKPDVMNRLLYRFGSDHHGFVRRNIPSMVFFTGLHDDYHKVTDTPDKIWYSNNTAIAKVVCRTLYLLAGGKEKE